MSNFQYDLLISTVRNQGVLTNSQSVGAESATVANTILQEEYNEATFLLNSDQQTTNATAPPEGQNWSTDDTNNFNSANANYQNDAAISQTGETNASTATQNLQSELSEDSTNLSNLNSLAQTLIQIGGYVASLINNAYT